MKKQYMLSVWHSNVLRHLIDDITENQRTPSIAALATRVGTNRARLERALIQLSTLGYVEFVGSRRALYLRVKKDLEGNPVRLALVPDGQL